MIDDVFKIRGEEQMDLKFHLEILHLIVEFHHEKIAFTF